MFAEVSDASTNDPENPSAIGSCLAIAPVCQLGSRNVTTRTVGQQALLQVVAAFPGPTVGPIQQGQDQQILLRHLA
eukprot:535582-Amphidinium_carterae.1